MISAICAYCGKPFPAKRPNQLYCNPYHSKLASKRRNIKPSICEVCGKEFMSESNRKTCSYECSAVLRHKHRSGTNANKGLPQESICWHCNRACSKPYELGGCNKFLYGKVCYNHALFMHSKTSNGTFTSIRVLECDHFIPDIRPLENYLEGEEYGEYEN